MPGNTNQHKTLKHVRYVSFALTQKLIHTFIW